MRTRNLILAGSSLLILPALAVHRRGVEARAAAQMVTAPRFEVDPHWPQPLPNRWILGSAVGVAVTSSDHILVINRTDSFNSRTEIGAATDPPTSDCCTPAPNVLEFDQAGALVRQWGGPGQGYQWPAENHRVEIDPSGNIWIGGSGGTDSQLLKFGPDGRFLMQVGQASGTAARAGGAGGGADTAYQGVAGAGRAGRGRAGGRGGRGGGAPALPPNSTSMDSFGGPASIAFDAAIGEGFVADGYRNHRIAVIDLQSGAIKRFFGAYGNAPADADLGAYTPGATAARQFRSPVACAELSRDGLLYVCDRTNNRLQVFRKDGSFVSEKVIAPNTLGDGSVWDVAFSHDPQQQYLYVADGMNMKIHVLNRQSLELLTSFGDGGRQPGQFLAVHSIAVDSQGNLYTAESSEGKRVQKFVFKGIGSVPRNQGVLWPTSPGGDR